MPFVYIFLFGLLLLIPWASAWICWRTVFVPKKGEWVVRLRKTVRESGEREERH